MYNLIEDKISYLKRLEIKTGRLIENLNYGRYLSVFRGTGMDFSEVRQYQYGDDVRFIDWNVSARFNELFVKQFNEERDLTVVLLIDISSSFLFGPNLSKFFTLAEFVALISFIVNKAGDNLSALFFSDKPTQFFSPKKGKKQVFKILDYLVNLNTDIRKTNLDLALSEALRLIKRNSVVFLISDFLQEINNKNLLHLCAKKFDFVVVRILHPIEKQIPQDLGLVLVQDPETGEDFILDTTDKQFLFEYKKYFEFKDKEFSKLLYESGLDLIDIEVERDYIIPLIKYFKLKNRRFGK